MIRHHLLGALAATVLLSTPAGTATAATGSEQPADPDAASVSAPSTTTPLPTEFVLTIVLATSPVEPTPDPAAISLWVYDDAGDQLPGPRTCASADTCAKFALPPGSYDVWLATPEFMFFYESDPPVDDSFPTVEIIDTDVTLIAQAFQLAPPPSSAPEAVPTTTDPATTGPAGPAPSTNNPQSLPETGSTGTAATTAAVFLAVGLVALHISRRQPRTP